MVGLLQIYFLFSLLFILIKCNPRDELRVRKTDQKLIEKQRQDTRDMCKIFNSEALRSGLSTKPLPLNKYDKRKKELKLKQKKEVIQNKKTRRIKRAVNSVNPALNIEDERRVESIVDKIYDDLLVKGQKITYRRKEIPIQKGPQRKKSKGNTSAHKPGRRFPFAPSMIGAEITSTLKIDTMIEELAGSKPARFADAIVPYFIDAKTYDTHLAEIITRAFDYFEKATCIRLQRLREKPTDPLSLENVTWLYISNPSGIRQCVHSNEKLEIQGVQHITLGYDCMSVGDISHEIMHVLGFAHEHVRPDRDQHITILWENIKPGYKQYFDIRDKSMVEGLPYDYASVMHYPPRAFSRNGKPTILTEQGIKIGQREALSEMDLEKISIVYSNECIKRNRDYLVKTCPDVVRAAVPPTHYILPQKINEYFKDRLWPYGVITYKFDTLMVFTFEEKENIKAVMNHISNQTCVQFVDLYNSEAIKGGDDQDSSSNYHFDTEELDNLIILSQSNSEDQSEDKNTKGSYEDNMSLFSGYSNSMEADLSSELENKDKLSHSNLEGDTKGNDEDNRDIISVSSTEGGTSLELKNLIILDHSNSEDDTKANNSEVNDEDSGGIFTEPLTSMEADPSLRFKINSNKIEDSGRTVRKGVKVKDNNGAKGNFVKRNNDKHIIGKGANRHDTNVAKGKITNINGKLKTTIATRKRTAPRRKRAVPPTPSRRHAGSILVLTRSEQPGCPCPTTGKPQDGSNPTIFINTDCFNTVNDLLHLFGHVLGLDHQHNMHDRDSYLHIQWDELEEDVRQEMKTKLAPEASVGYPYDYHSVMHYPWLQIKNGKTNMIYPIWNDGWAMGHWQGLSAIDVEKIQSIYNQACLERKALEKQKKDNGEEKKRKDEDKKGDKDEEEKKKDEDEEKEIKEEDEEEKEDKKDEDEEEENKDEDEEEEKKVEDEEEELFPSDFETS